MVYGSQPTVDPLNIQEFFLTFFNIVGQGIFDIFIDISGNDTRLLTQKIRYYDWVQKGLVGLCPLRGFQEAKHSQFETQQLPMKVNPSDTSYI